MLQHVPQTSPHFLSAEIYKSFKCKLSIHHPHFSLVQFGCQGFFRQLKDLHILQLQFRHSPCLWGNKMGWEKPRDWHTGKLRPLCLLVGSSEEFVYIWFRMPCISLGSAAVFDQVLIETCSNSCKLWTGGSSDSDAMMKLKSVSYYSTVIVTFNGYMIIISCHFSKAICFQ